MAWQFHPRDCYGPSALPAGWNHSILASSVYLAVFVGASFVITLYLLRNDPALLRRRLSGGPTAEKERGQKIAMLVASIGFIALLLVPAFGNRFNWSSVPLSFVIAGDILTALCFYIWYLVYKEN